MIFTKKIKLLIYIIGSVILLLLWQHFGASVDNIRLFISSPTQIWRYFLENRIDLLSATFITLLESSLGLIIATIFSFSMMVLCFYQESFLEIILPLMISSQVIPIIVFAPFMILLFGIGFTSKIALAAIISFFPIFLNFLTGYKSISSNIIEYFKINNASKTFQIFNVFFPLSLPNIFTGLKLGATLSVIGAIVSEFTGAKAGLGKNLFLTSIRIEPELMMLSIILSMILGALLFGTILFIEKILGKWYLY